MGVLKEELKKIGGPDSPKLRGLMNKGLTEWIGSPEFVGVNAAWANFQETAARVYSGQYGAGGTPVSYLKLSQDSMGTNPNLDQLMHLDQTMTRLFDARRRAASDTEKNLISKVVLTPKEGSVAPETQKARDTDAAQILKEEGDKSLAAFNSKKDPSKWRDYLSTLRELRK